ncbi:MAG: hypothetical protein IJN50_07590 [Clostridia bacterium]|nr:hypothetical protein [Clostridia bacterium]
MEEKEYLSEEKYRKTKKKLRRIALSILIIGIISGLILIGIGIYINTTRDKSVINDIRVQIDKEITDNGVSLKYYELRDELDKEEDKYNSCEQFYAIGSVVIVLSCLISTYMFVIVKGREINAFAAQQGMPIAKEVIEKTAPSVGKVAKEIKNELKKEEK